MGQSFSSEPANHQQQQQQQQPPQQQKRKSLVIPKKLIKLRRQISQENSGASAQNRTKGEIDNQPTTADIGKNKRKTDVMCSLYH
jgi:hypothetical protein